MCDFSNGFILCTCKNVVIPQHENIHHKKSKKNKKKQFDVPTVYEWTLYKYIGLSKEIEFGRYMLPQSEIGHGLTSEFVAVQLNSKKCFDFDYSPGEGDNLLINNKADWSRLEFLFKDGKWIANHYDPFTHEKKIIEEGRVKEPFTNTLE